MPAKIIWNDELDRALRDLVEAGANREACETAMGISWPVLRPRLRELGVVVTPSREIRPRTLQAIALVRGGRSTGEAAKLSGVHKDTIRAAMRRMARARSN